MHGECKYCAKEKTCNKPTGAMFGFCNTDFEPNPITVKIIYEDGDFTITKFNGTFEEAKEYYIGKQFNLGEGSEDYMVECVAIEEIS